MGQILIGPNDPYNFSNLHTAVTPTNRHLVLLCKLSLILADGSDLFCYRSIVSGFVLSLDHPWCAASYNKLCSV